MAIPDHTTDVGVGGLPKTRAQRRIWLLLVIESLERCGLTPIRVEQLHRLIYLANALSPLYDVPTADGELLKYRRGPFYPDLQWDIDRLAVMGLIELSGLRFVREHATVWLEAKYGLAEPGLAILRKAILHSPAACSRRAFYLEVAGAYAQLTTEAQTNAAFQDANYRQPNIRDNQMIDFSDVKTNRSISATEYFDEWLPANAANRDRGKLYLYFQYLNQMVERETHA